MATLPFGKTTVELRDDSAGASTRSSHIAALNWTNLSSDFTATWMDLAKRSSEPNPFFEPWALLPALHAFAKAGDVSILAYYEEGTLSGLLPVTQTSSYYGYPIPHLSAWKHDNQFCGVPLISPGSEKGLIKALCEWANGATKLGQFFHLSDVPEHGPLYTALKEFVLTNSVLTGVVHREDRAMLRSEQSPEDYFVGSMSGKKRKELRRQLNRLSEEGDISFECQIGSDGIDIWTDQFLALEANGWKGQEKTALSDNPQNDSFFRQTLRGAAQMGRLERLALSLDGRPIAMLVNFITPPGAYSFKTTFDEAYSRFSPGVLLQRKNLDLLSHPKIKWVDSCAAADHPMIERIWREKRSVVRINIGLGGPIRAAIFRQMLRRESGVEIIGKA